MSKLKRISAEKLKFSTFLIKCLDFSFYLPNQSSRYQVYLVSVAQQTNLFDCLRLYLPVNNFSVILGRLPGCNHYLKQIKAIGMKCLAQGHNAPQLMIKPATLGCLAWSETTKVDFLTKGLNI